MAAKKTKPATKLAHGGRHTRDHFGFVNTPVYRGSTVLYENTAALKARNVPYVYGRKGTPTTASLESVLTELEGGAGTVLTPSGLSAITTSLQALLNAGDHILITDSVYRPTRVFADDILQRMGVAVEYYDPLIGADIDGLVKENTRVVYLEAPGSQTFEMQDVPAIVSALKDAGSEIYTIFDNTWATALYFRALDFDVDITLQAGTKYAGGHSDIMLGAATANDRTWKRLHHTHDTLGLGGGTEETFLALRGLRTMEVRLEKHMSSAMKIAEWLNNRREVAEVMHPGLPEAAGHDIWKRDFQGSSGLFSIRLNPVPEDAVDTFLDALQYFGLGYSWGGFESLAIPFDPTSYRSVSDWDKTTPGVRFHIGLEDPDDLIADLDNAFIAMSNVKN